MSFESQSEFKQYSRFQHFSFFEEIGATVNPVISIAPGVIFQVKELRLHLSSPYSLVGDLALRLSAAKGSAYDIILYSHAMSGSTDVFWYPSTASNTLQFLSDDVFIISLPMTSGAILGGINVQGWTIEG